MNDPRFPVVKINVVEQEGWKPYDSANTTDFRASDAAHEDFQHMSANDIESYVSDLADAKGPKGGKPKRRFSSEEIEWLAEQVRERNKDLEETRNAIPDAMTWTYEAAALPHKGDMIDALVDARHSIIDNYPIETGDENLWEPVLELESRRRGPKEWSPRKRFEREELLKDLMKHVHFEWDEGKYDRFVIFDFRNAQVTHDLLSRSHWTQKELIPMLQDEFKNLERDFMIDFFSSLEKIMEDIDVSNRTDWRKSWRSMLNSGIAPVVQREMAEALKGMDPDAD